MREHLHSWLVARNDKTHVQLFRYGLVAIVAFTVDFGVYTFLVKVPDWNPVLAATVGFCLGLTVNYLLSVRWVFDTRSHSRRQEMIIFFLIGFAGLVFTDWIIWAIAVAAGKDEILAKIIATIVVFFWNFGARKFILFSSKEKPWRKADKKRLQ